MGNNLINDLNEQEREFERFYNHDLPNKLMKMAQKNVHESFIKEQYQDGKSQKWKGRKKDKDGKNARDSRRGLLIDKGDLIKSVDVEKIGHDIVIGTDVEYAKPHNEGAEIHQGARTELHPRLRITKGKNKGKFKKGKNYYGLWLGKNGHGMEFKDKTIELPQRQFMPIPGDPPPFQKEADQYIDKSMDKILG